MSELIGDAPGDFAAWHKLITGSWVYNIVTGDVISMNTGKPLVFRSERSGPSLRTYVHGHRFTVKKDRVAQVAFWIGRCEGHIPLRRAP
ncbi:hypothetical protein Mlab_0906 [Methanocorpusculum labreanum Z]|uniref:Uncharacterized protein n=1 Tax=Methanocorpusculum labreanum (strain ATCC 43576 / DSM 4855 / Z) TaxID=410358 RepID=A2SRX1_METLZ|nr:hypothetical protein [Methanocorpusculum labreanum]ABN07077.1 hypothetical protein Mlab_0906 [Methanocorpusculum labreanum Z]